MLETPHAAVGAALAVAIPNPFIAIPLAFTSHFVLDKVPHWNPHIYTEIKKHGKLSNKTTSFIVGDTAVAGILSVVMANAAAHGNTMVFTVVLLGAFAGILPDLMEMPYYFLNMRKGWMHKFVLSQKSIQVHSDSIYGLLSQAVILVAALWWFVQLI